jgi:hypothetical protein
MQMLADKELPPPPPSAVSSPAPSGPAPAAAGPPLLLISSSPELEEVFVKLDWQEDFTISMKVRNPFAGVVMAAISSE